MRGITPRRAELQQLTTEYLSDVQTLVKDSVSFAQTSQAFSEVYHTSLSAEAVLTNLDIAEFRPRLSGARSIVLRLPLLVAIGQQSVAAVDLRRFVELICWTVYFTDHPIEWLSFQANTGTGFSNEARQPISYAAHRDISYYVDYSNELMKPEPSGLGVESIESIKQVLRELNRSVHAGHMAHETTKKLPHDEISEIEIRKFAQLQRRVFSNCCLLLAAYSKLRFNRLSAVARAHFDWLVGAKLRKRVRQGPFGLNNRSTL